ncbi:hypothetical protein C8J27_102476 [Rhodobacter aestuarii]|uniref:Uncharacterized protein n=1 Tax=Rhodobacter aestuarii TaxID=453582 RepID=A0A1N7MLP0_9RHOB|nr:hypothetical protein C8J27_102476 [Rhodobacter aestuarii]SIS87017.1 hypothetical protein SAMN05421580_10645 [Rhodobacter aestuarii]SOB90889.1 hypothetical protein SAMN05877809_101256 [Rhodobacter sp. JA431]
MILSGSSRLSVRRAAALATRGQQGTAPEAVWIGVMGASPGPARHPLHRGCRA